jgi:hypothetical protein
MAAENVLAEKRFGFNPMIHLVLLAAALLMASPAVGAPEIGKATEITTEVTGDDAGSIRVLKAGDRVFQEERIATDDKGIGQFEFHDDTRLAIGPGSVVKLDRFVYGANRSATAVTVQLTKGAFRFISGKSASGAYQIATPTATIGVRGTTFDVFVAADGEMAVAMIDGGVDVCARRGGCQAHNVVGRYLHLTPAGAISVRERWDGTFLRNVSFTTALPFLARPEALGPRFRASSAVAGRYRNAVPAHLLRSPAVAPTRVKGAPKATPRLAPKLAPKTTPKMTPKFEPKSTQKQKFAPKEKEKRRGRFR